MFVQIIRLVSFVFGAIFGAIVAEFVQVDRYFGANHSYGLILFVILGASIGYLLGSAVGRQLQKLLAWVEQRINRLPGWEILVGVAGLIVGLVLASLVSQPVYAISSPQLRSVVMVVVFVVLGVFGLQLAITKKEDFGRFLTGRGRGVGVSEEAARPKVLDTSVIIDGRITDLVRTHFIEGRLIVPTFVLRELQMIADSEDRLKRNRGRRGLDVLNVLQREEVNPVEIYERDFPETPEVDTKLVQLASELGGAILTNDYNLNKVAAIQGVTVLSINELANAIKPVVLPGEEMDVHVLREGKEAGQGVAYLDDGTMVVVDGGKKLIGEDIGVVITSVLQTPAGRMIFGRVKESPPGA